MEERSKLKQKYYNKILENYTSDIKNHNKNNKITFPHIETDIKIDEIFLKLNNSDKEYFMEEFDIFVNSYNKHIAMITNRDLSNFEHSNANTKHEVTKIINEDSYTTTGKAILTEIMSDEKHKQISDIFFWNKFKNDSAPAQRTPDWYRIRNESITASDCGTVLNQNKYEKQFGFIKKKVYGSVFETNYACYWGKKYENAINLMYEHINKVTICEFGLISSDTVKILAASPDGIVYPYHNGLPSPYAGRMIEIKCPITRKINHTGMIKGDICPIYYYCQIQQQLHCCNLNECDFVQCKIEAYNTKLEYIADTHETYDYFSKRTQKLRGVVIQKMPRKYHFDNYLNKIVPDEDIWNYADFIYPPKLTMTIKETDEWIENEKNKLANDNEFYFHTVFYWYCSEMLTTLILRETDWIENNIKTLEKIWNYVIFLRENKVAFNEFETYLSNLKIENNTHVLKKLDEMILKSKK